MRSPAAPGSLPTARKGNGDSSASRIRGRAMLTSSLRGACMECFGVGVVVGVVAWVGMDGFIREDEF